MSWRPLAFIYYPEEYWRAKGKRVRLDHYTLVFKNTFKTSDIENLDFEELAIRIKEECYKKGMEELGHPIRPWFAKVYYMPLAGTDECKVRVDITAEGSPVATWIIIAIFVAVFALIGLGYYYVYVEYCKWLWWKEVWIKYYEYLKFLEEHITDYPPEDRKEIKLAAMEAVKAPEKPVPEMDWWDYVYLGVACVALGLGAYAGYKAIKAWKPTGKLPKLKK